MASVDWQKATTQKAGAMKRHNGKTERVEVNHSNTHIDKSKSHLNIYIGADDYAPMLEKVKARIKQVDKEHPPKRNQGDRRITCILLETPVPQAITEQGKAADFLRNAHKVIEDFFGAENVGGTCGHLDEQHWYIDKNGTERLSLVHGHTVVAAYAEWTDKKTGEKRIGINGKNCETKARLTALNKAMDEMCRKKYGISYNTAETPERKSVERLKEETELRREADTKRKELKKIKEQQDALKGNVQALQEQISQYNEIIQAEKENAVASVSVPSMAKVFLSKEDKDKVLISVSDIEQLRADEKAVAVVAAANEKQSSELSGKAMELADRERLLAEKEKAAHRLLKNAEETEREAQSKLQQAEQRYKKMQKEPYVASLQERIKELFATNKDLSADWREENQKYKKAKEELRDTEREIEPLKRQNSEFSEKIRSLEEQVQKLSGEIEAKTREIGELTKGMAYNLELYNAACDIGERLDPDFNAFVDKRLDGYSVSHILDGGKNRGR